MEKLVYVVWAPPETSERALRERMLGPVAEEMRALGTPRLAMNLADEDVAYARAQRLTRLDPPPAGTVSFWLDAADDRGPYEEVLGRAGLRAAGYLVCESVPLRNTAHPAPAGQRTPGTNMVALLERPERIAWEDWIAHWHGHHKRVALETQCTFQYIRNVVVRPLTEGAPPWEGIVEESFPAEAVTDPMRWYQADGDPAKLKENLGRMIESVKAFLDMDRVESHPMSEYRLEE